ncbi:MAG: hypothetical protein KIT43_10360 [Bauldia sp.]|nr:hypothetical protein [Bauldia sp.]
MLTSSTSGRSAFVRPWFTRGTGLGNRLFPYSRALLLARSTGAEFIEPEWFDFRRGPIMREGRLLGGLSPRALLGKVWLYDNFRHEKWIERPGSVRAVSGDGNAFADLVGHHEAILEHLLSRATETVRAELKPPTPPIVLNVRLARDFQRAQSPEDFRLKGAIRSPLDFYAIGLEDARSRLGRETPAAVVSDGTDAELAPLLAQPNVTRFRSSRALSDLLFMARARFIVGTGGSSFSAWGAFLAQCEVVTINGQSLSWFKLGDANRAIVRTIEV